MTQSTDETVPLCPPTARPRADAAARIALGFSLSTLLLAGLFVGCDAPLDDAPVDAAPVDAGPPVDAHDAGPLHRPTASDVIARMGGLDALTRIGPQLIVESDGEIYELAEGAAPQLASEQTGSFHLRTMRDLRTGRDRFEWHVETLTPIASTLDYVETTDVSVGWIQGIDQHFTFAQEHPMLPAHIGARLKQQRLSTGLAMMMAVASGAEVAFLSDVEQDGVRYATFSVPDVTGTPLTVAVDWASQLPAWLETTEDDPFLGDVRYTVSFADWRAVEGLMLPFEITHAVEGFVTLIEHRQTVSTGPVDENRFVIPPEHAAPVSIMEARRGELRSQWFLRQHQVGFGSFAPVPPVRVVEVGPGVLHLLGTTHHSLAVELSDRIVVVEAPIDGDYAQQVLEVLAERFPGKPVEAVINTHWHHDHAGGLRTYLAAGAHVLTAADNAPLLRDVLMRPHTVSPDALTRAPRELDIVEIEERLRLGDPDRAIDVYRIDCAHAQGMLIVHIPHAGVLFNSDLYSPAPGIPDPGAALDARDLLRSIESLGLEVSVFAGGHGLGTGTLDELVALADQADVTPPADCGSCASILGGARPESLCEDNAMPSSRAIFEALYTCVCDPGAGACLTECESSVCCRGDDCPDASGACLGCVASQCAQSLDACASDR